eukprot:gene17127-20364_t
MDAPFLKHYIDTNKDNILSAEELERIRQIGAPEHRELLRFDANNDGVLDAGEFEALCEVEAGEKRLEILGYVEECLAEIIDRKGHYFNMFAFIGFSCFYFAVLFIQRSAFLAYDITHTVSDTGLRTGAYEMDAITLELFPLGDNGLRYISDETSEVALCWWPEWQRMGDAEFFTQELQLLNAEWKLLVDSPVGGLSAHMHNTSSGELLASLQFCRPCMPRSVLCESSADCQRINVAFDNDARTLRCFLLAAECDSPHGLHAEAGFKVAAFRRGIQQVKHFLSAEDAESRYLRAYADSVCDPGEPRAMLLLHLGENCPECVAVQVKEQPSNESDWSSGSVGRRTMDDESCVIPFPVRSHVFPDCEWRADDNATFHDTVRNQSRWTCPVTTSYDADAIEIGTRGDRDTEHLPGNVLCMDMPTVRALCERILPWWSVQLGMAGYDMIGFGECVVEHWPSAYSSPEVYGILDEMEPMNSTECAAACTGMYECQAFSSGDGLRCKLFSMIPDKVWTESELATGPSKCYVKIFGLRFITRPSLGEGYFMDEEVCTALGLHMVHIRSDEENAKLTRHLWALEEFTYSVDYLGYSSWIGLVEANRTDSETPNPATDSVFTWTDDGTLLDYIPNDVSDFGQGRGFYVEGPDLQSGYHAIELCGLNPNATYTLQGWDKSAPRLGLSTRLFSDPKG